MIIVSALLMLNIVVVWWQDKRTAKIYAISQNQAEKLDGCELEDQAPEISVPEKDDK